MPETVFFSCKEKTPQVVVFVVVVVKRYASYAMPKYGRTLYAGSE